MGTRSSREAWTPQRISIRQTGDMELGRFLEYESSGSGEAILFIHGAIVTDSFAPIMREKALANNRRIRYRRRGVGRSAMPTSQPTIEEYARDAKALLDDLGVTEVVTQRASLQLFRAAVPHTLAEVLSNADHIVPMTEPGTVANVIANFLGGRPDWAYSTGLRS